MRCSGRDADGISLSDRKPFFSERHKTAARKDMVNLFAPVMLMEICYRTGRDVRFGKALTLIEVDGGMHEFPDDGAVFGNIGLNFFVVSFLYHESSYPAKKDIGP